MQPVLASGRESCTLRQGRLLLSAHQRLSASFRCVIAWCGWLQDEISTGLDSSTTYLITKCIRNFVHMQDVSSSCLYWLPHLPLADAES